MSKQDRKEVARSLKEQIKTTTDPEQLIKLTREYNRVTNPRYGRKPSVKKAEATPSGKTSALVAKWAGRLSHVEPEAKRIMFSVINEHEKSKIIPLKELMDSLSAEERAALEALSSDGVPSHG